MPLTLDSSRKGRELSNVEQQIHELLQIEFPEQKWQINGFYKELKSLKGHSLQLDFYSPELDLAIEANDPSHRVYESFQRYDPVKNTLEKFQEKKENDQQKMITCLIHHTYLIEINYGSDVDKSLTLERQLKTGLLRWRQRRQVKDEEEPSNRAILCVSFVLILYLVYSLFVSSR